MEGNIQQSLTIAQLASMVILTEKKLKAGFKEMFGTGVHAYFRNLRIEQVKVMLAQNKPLKEIAKTTGFKSVASLSHTFKKVVGINASEWKTRHEEPAMTSTD